MKETNWHWGSGLIRKVWQGVSAHCLLRSDSCVLRWFPYACLFIILWLTIIFYPSPNLLDLPIILKCLQQIKRTPITIGENKIAIKINIIFCLLKISFDNCFFSLSLMSKYWYSNIREAWSGTLFPNSHFEIVCRVTKTTSASCCWVKPFFNSGWFNQIWYFHSCTPFIICF